MEKLNKIAIVMSLAFLMLFSGRLNANDYDLATGNISCEAQEATLLASYDEIEKGALVDCTITINNDDGTSLEVTFHDISWFQCAKIKVGKWFRDTF